MLSETGTFALEHVWDSTFFSCSQSGLKIQREIAVMLRTEGCKVHSFVSCTICVRSNFLLCMAYTEAISLHTLEKSMMHIQGIFEEATKEVTVCGLMQKSSEEVL